LGPKKIFDILRNLGILMSNNVPYQRYIDDGYFKTKESHIAGYDGIKLTTLITAGRGQDWLIKMLTGKGYLQIAQ
jgi:anti-repressor protein